MKAMNKYLFLAASALLAFASCSANDFVGGNNPNDPDGSDAIAFGSGFKAVTRANTIGADAAALLGNNFVVYGAKSTATTVADKFADTKVFDHYNVNFITNSAGTTSSNTSDWEYVGQDKHAHATTTAQTVKYWDLSAAEYDFIAYSTGTATEASSGDPASGKLVVSAITPATAKISAYTIKGATADDLAKIYVADIKTVLKANYKNEVVFNFRSLATKVRIGLYETIPGYSVKDVKFYSADATVGDGTPYLYGGATAFNAKGTFTVSYPTIGYANANNSDYNKAHVSFAPAASEGQSDLKTFGALTPKVALTDDATSGDYLGRIDEVLKEKRVVFFDSGVHGAYEASGTTGSDKVNICEARMVADLLRRIHRFYGKRFSAQKTVGVIVPYRNQIAMIRQEISQLGIAELLDVSIDTVERYQGSQRDVIIYSFTISHTYQLDFLAANTFMESGGHIIDRKLNVALTRARCQMLMIGNASVLSQNDLFRKLIEQYSVTFH